jgi:Flp pilus assembly protein TadD
VEVLSVLPHMHYLGKEAHAWAELPDGTQRELLLIKRWDFDWQGDYSYLSPVPLPRGTTLRMRYTYDNSADNPQNPSQPPRRVTYGILSSDEMGELWLQVALRDPDDFLRLRQEYERTYAMPDNLARAEMMVRLHPHDAQERLKLARTLVVLQRTDEALQQLERSMEDDATIAEAHYVMGTIYTRRNAAEKARLAFERAVELDPLHAKAHNNLGWVLFVIGQREAGLRHLEKAVELDPKDELARKNLSRARLASPLGR